jgi:hypothetical protein
MLREALPEKDWTPWQRETMRGWNRLWTRDRQWLRIEEWKEHTRDWVCLCQIADWYSRRPGDVERDHRRRMQAHCDLQQSIILGEFGHGKRLRVIYLPPEPPSLRYAVRLRLSAEHGWAHQGRALDHILDLCWAPRELCLRWLVARQIVPPPWLAAEPIRVEPAHVPQTSKSGTSACAPSPLRAPKDRIHAAIDTVYAASTGKPPNLKQIVPPVKADLNATNQIATWKEIQHCAKDPRHTGKRRPQGRTLKSERSRRSDS